LVWFETIGDGFVKIIIGLFLILFMGAFFLKKNHFDVDRLSLHTPSTSLSFLPTPHAEKEQKMNPIKKEIQTIKSLTPREKQIFYGEVQHVFLDQAPGRIDSSSVRKNIIQLNERGIVGVEAIFEELNKIPETEFEGRRRIAYIDYLKYRMRWDSETRTRAKEWFLNGSENQFIPYKSIAMILADKTELIGGFARVSQDVVQDVLSALGPSLLYDLCVQEVLGVKEKK
jgi:hypothetical protein